MGRGICTQAIEKRAESWPEVWGNGISGVSGHADPGPKPKEAKNERVTWSVWATTSECLQLPKPSPTSSFISSRGRSANGCWRDFFQPPFWRFPLPTPVSVVTSWPLKTREWDSPTLTYPKRTILSARLTLGMKAFDYLAFLLISYNALGSFYKAIWLADINAETMRNLPFCGPAMCSHPFQSLCGSQGSAVDIAPSDSSLFRHPRSLAVEEIKDFFWKHHGKENICSVTVPLQLCSYAPWLEV